MSDILKTISLDGFTKNVRQYQAGSGITFTPDSQDTNTIVVSAVATDLSNYYTKNEVYNKSEVDDLIDAINDFNVQIVSELPQAGEDRTIYLVPKNPTQTNNVKDEYMWINGAWEKIGDTEIDLSGYYTSSEVDALLDDKVDKETGKGLSTNDYTTAEKDKLAGIEAGAEVNVQADWNQSDSTADDYIKNKPGNATTSADGLMSSTDKTKLDGIETGAEANVQSDWNQTDTTADDYIKNKPGNATQSTAGLMSDTDKTKLDGIQTGAEANVQADWNQSDSTADDYIKNKPDLSNFITCATVGDCQTIQDMQDDIDSKQDALTKAAILSILGYEEVQLSMTDTDGNTITKTILAQEESNVVTP